MCVRVVYKNTEKTDVILHEGLLSNFYPDSVLDDHRAVAIVLLKNLYDARAFLQMTMEEKAKCISVMETLRQASMDMKVLRLWRYKKS